MFPRVPPLLKTAAYGFSAGIRCLLDENSVFSLSHRIFSFTSILPQWALWRTRLHFLLSVSRRSVWRTVSAGDLRWLSGKPAGNALILWGNLDLFFRDFQWCVQCVSVTLNNEMKYLKWLLPFFFAVSQDGVQSAATVWPHLQCAANIWSARVHDSWWVTLIQLRGLV